MEEIYSIKNLDCAHCAAKVEEKIRSVAGVEDATVVFATMQLRLIAENPDALLPQVLAAAQTVEPGISFHSHRHTHSSVQECHCHHHSDSKEKHSSLLPILGGAGLFVLGLFAGRLSTVCFIAAYLMLGWEILLTAGKNLFRGKVLDENFLMGIATLGAFAIGESAEAVGVMLFYRIGEFFEHKAMERSRSQIMAAVDMRPQVVHLQSGETIPAEEAKIGDVLLVRPGDRIPLDGTVIQGQSRLDTAPITGEPVPMGVTVGDSVTSGCINGEGLLTIRVEKPLSESMVTRILNCVESAAAGKPKMDRFLTRFARVYTPAVVLLALGVAIIPSIFDGNWGYWIYTALSFLVMSCPCALVLSVPLAFFSGIGVGGRRGILFKSGIAIEAMAQVKTVALDKTGTLTKGDFSVQNITSEGVLALCAACEQHSTHPIAKSILAAAEGLSLPHATQIEEISGEGIHAVIKGKQVLCGNQRLLARFGVSLDTTKQELYGTQVYVAENGTVLGYLTIADTVKPDAKETIARLQRAGISTAILTGDQSSSAQAVADAVGITQVYSQLLPQEKLQRL